MTTTRAVADHDDLAEFGYDQQLHRSLGKFESFAAGFSFVSILTTIFQLFGLGFGFGGPAFFWTWPLRVPRPVLGRAVLRRTRRPLPDLRRDLPVVAPGRRRGIGWFAGWFMIIAQIVTASAAAIALQVVLPSIWSGFQIVGDDPALTSPSGARTRCCSARSCW